MGDLLVRGGTIVDGTGGPAVRGDGRIRGGLITEVGMNLRVDGEEDLDASGALVTGRDGRQLQRRRARRTQESAYGGPW
jgi:N-acyl-D-aspartate/D-glutamate deacylase